MKVFFQFFLVFCFIFDFGFLVQAEKKRSYVEYINRYSDIAVKHRDVYKISAAITLAQGILESGAGQSELAKSSNNHFGIKCHSDWQGERVYRKDDILFDCFRKYKKVEDSYDDHSKFLLKPRYAVLFTYDIRDYVSWAKGLQSCGYATDKGYANKLISLIEEYELYKFDAKTPAKKTTTEVSKQPEPKQPAVTQPATTQPAVTQPAIKQPEVKPATLVRTIYKTYNLIYVLAEEGDTFAKIAQDTDFKEKDLIKYNDASADFPLRKGDIVYLQEKKTMADKPNFEHVVKIGESMHSISQRYGIRIKNLYTMNKKSDGYIVEGEVLRLR